MTAFWTKLAKREKYAVASAGACFILFLVWLVIVSPFIEHRDKTYRALKAKTTIVREMRDLQSKYRSISGKTAQTPKTGETVFSFVEKTARETGLKENLASINPSETNDPQTGKKRSRVEIRFQGIDPDQLVVFLHRVESSGQAVIENITVTRSGGDKPFLNSNMLIVSR